MALVMERQGPQISAATVGRLIERLKEQLTPLVLAQEISDQALREFVQAERERRSIPYEVAWKLLSVAYRHGLFWLIPEHGIPVVPYDPRTDVRRPAALRNLKPIGYEQHISAVPLRQQRTEIAGRWVDFPLGLPASILAAHSDWIGFFAERGFCILTYKTVRSVEREAHPLPNWVFLRDDQVSLNGVAPLVADPDYWPDAIDRVSMANSFGIPSFAPEVWEADLAVARNFVQEGHQILIASVVASVDGLDAITEDFVNSAVRAQRAGADMIELNFSCPNTQGEYSGQVYQQSAAAAHIAGAVKEALIGTNTPLLAKIGYLGREPLADFVFKTAPYLDGIVGINTISAPIVTTDGDSTFPDRNAPNDRREAGVSGWAIKEPASEVARNLVQIRDEVMKETNKRLTILSVGGVLGRSDFDDRLAMGVDGVEVCTGAFLNPHIGLHIRFEQELDNAILKPDVSKRGPGANRRSSVGGVDVASEEGGGLNNDDPDTRPATSRVAVEFQQEVDFRQAVTLYMKERPSEYFGVPGSLTLIVPRKELEWLESVLRGRTTRYKLLPVLPMSDLPSDEAVRLRGRGQILDPALRTTKGRRQLLTDLRRELKLAEKR